MPFYHPQDTNEVYSMMDKSQMENLWYRIHFNQVINHRQSRGQERLNTINEAVIPTMETKKKIGKTMSIREMALASLDATHYIKISKGKLNGKLIHGLGAAHVRETALTLHPLYGVPYIPSTSLKGALRNWVIQSFFQGKEDSIKIDPNLNTKQNEIVKIFVDLFGDQTQRGLLQCHDSFTSDDFVLSPDILTVHFKDYYSSKSSATDDQSPNPVVFYVVENATFQFVLTMLKRNGEKTLSGHSTRKLIDLAYHWLKSMLKEQGIGSKTASGYGYFKELEDITEGQLQQHIEQKKVWREKQKQEDEKRRIAREEEEIQAQIAEKIKNMSPSQRMVHEIESLSSSVQFDQDKSKNEFFTKVKEFASNGEIEPARALKKYWQEANSWKANKKSKQFEKVKTIKQILGE